MRQIIIALLAAVAMTSTVYAKDHNKHSSRVSPTQQYTQYISKQDAAQIALDTIWQKYQKNGLVDDVDLKNKNGEAYYKVEVEMVTGQEYDIYIDAVTGAVKQTAVSYEEAGKIAIDAVFERYQQQGRIDDVDLEYKNGQSYYEVEIKTPSGMEFEVYINAQTGKVLRIKIDD